MLHYSVVTLEHLKYSRTWLKGIPSTPTSLKLLQKNDSKTQFHIVMMHFGDAWYRKTVRMLILNALNEFILYPHTFSHYIMCCGKTSFTINIKAYDSREEQQHPRFYYGMALLS